MNTRALLFALLVGSMTLAGTPHEPVGRTWESGDFGGSADSTYLADSTGVRQSGRIRVKLPGAEGGWGDLLAFEASAMDGESARDPRRDRRRRQLRRRRAPAANRGELPIRVLRAGQRPHRAARHLLRFRPRRGLRGRRLGVGW